MSFGNDDFPGGHARFTALRSRIEAVVLVPSARLALDAWFAVAVHEAGHVVVDHHHGLEVRGASIEEAAGKAHVSVTGPAVEALLDSPGPSAVLPLIAGALAGIVAELLACTHPDWRGAYSDLVFADQFARLACDSEDAVDALLAEAAQAAQHILRVRWSALGAVAAALLEHRALTSEKLATLLG